MASLPSFVDLMASLGLGQKERPSSKSTSSPHLTQHLISPLAARCHPDTFPRNPTVHKQRMRRFSPYSLVDPLKRHGSFPSTPTPEPKQHRCHSPDKGRRNLAHPINFFDPMADLDANAPISIYVRRKTSGGSNQSSTTSHESDDGLDTQVPCIPILPSLLPNDSCITNSATPATSSASNREAQPKPFTC
ncbi:hypothetical protein AX15_006375 [Amanita polypyramis BW_CC]|nr:hypothetical protein AX15_006375 [Amanita polypyramis BW_CC]